MEKTSNKPRKLKRKFSKQKKTSNKPKKLKRYSCK